MSSKIRKSLSRRFSLSSSQSQRNSINNNHADVNGNSNSNDQLQVQPSNNSNPNDSLSSTKIKRRKSISNIIFGGSNRSKSSHKRKSIRLQRAELLEQEASDGDFYDQNGIKYASGWHKVIAKHDWIQLEEMIKVHREEIASQKSRRYSTSVSSARRSNSFDASSSSHRRRSVSSSSSSSRQKQPPRRSLSSSMIPSSPSASFHDIDNGWSLTDQYGRTSLHLACMEGVPSSLLQHLINLDSSSLSSSLFTQADYDGQYVIHAATQSVHITDDDLERIIKLCPQSLLATDKKGQIPLHCAINTARQQVQQDNKDDIWTTTGNGNHQEDPPNDSNDPALSASATTAEGQQQHAHTKCWGLQLTSQQIEWENQQHHHWKKVVLILQLMKSKRKAVPAKDQPRLICQAMEVGAPVEVIELLTTCCKPQQQSKVFSSYLQLCAKAISYVFVYNYPLSLLQKLLGAASYDEGDPPKKILQALRKGFMKHYKAGFDWRININDLPNSKINETLKKQLPNHILSIRSEVMRYYRVNRQQIVQSDTTLNSIRAKTKTPLHPSCQAWWSMLKFLLLYTTTRDPSKLKSQHLLHVALSIPACPPSIIELIVSVHPFSRQMEDPRYPGALPVHIACQFWKHEKSQEDQYSVEEVLISKVIGNYDYHWAWRRYQDRIPIQHAIAKGKTWSFLEPLVRIDRRTLAVRDPTTKLYPFQLAAAYYQLEIETRGYDRVEAERQKTIMSEVKSRLTIPWSDLSAEEQNNVYSKVEIEQELRQVTTVFELIKAYPDAIGHGAINNRGQIESSSAIASSNDLVDAGIVSSYFLGWIYLRNKYTGEWKIDPDRMDLIDKAINSEMFYIVDMMRGWWNNLLTYVWQSYDGSLGKFNKKSAKFLIHCALVNIDTPPKVIGLLVKQFPKSLKEPIPGTTLYPIHIAAASSSTYIPQSFEVPYEKSSLDYIREGTPKFIFVETESGGRTPLHIAIASGKRRDEIHSLVQKDKKSLLLPDPETGLLPFQLMSVHCKLSTDQKRRLILGAKERLAKLTVPSSNPIDPDPSDSDQSDSDSINNNSNKSILHWSDLSKPQKALLLRKPYTELQTESLSCIYELLRAQPLALKSIRKNHFKFQADDDDKNDFNSDVPSDIVLEDEDDDPDPATVEKEPTDDSILDEIHDGIIMQHSYICKRLIFEHQVDYDSDSESSIESSTANTSRKVDEIVNSDTADERVTIDDNDNINESIFPDADFKENEMNARSSCRQQHIDENEEHDGNDFQVVGTMQIDGGVDYEVEDSAENLCSKDSLEKSERNASNSEGYTLLDSAEFGQLASTVNAPDHTGGRTVEPPQRRESEKGDEIKREDHNCEMLNSPTSTAITGSDKEVGGSLQRQREGLELDKENTCHDDDSELLDNLLEDAGDTEQQGGTKSNEESEEDRNVHVSTLESGDDAACGSTYAHTSEDHKVCTSDDVVDPSENHPDTVGPGKEIIYEDEDAELLDNILGDERLVKQHNGLVRNIKDDVVTEAIDCTEPDDDSHRDGGPNAVHHLTVSDSGHEVGGHAEDNLCLLKDPESNTLQTLTKDASEVDPQNHVHNGVKEAEQARIVDVGSVSDDDALLDSILLEDEDLVNDQDFDDSSSSSSRHSSSSSDDSIIDDNALLARLPGLGKLVKRIDSQHEQVSHRLLESQQTLSSPRNSKIHVNLPIVVQPGEDPIKAKRAFNFDNTKDDDSSSSSDSDSSSASYDSSTDDQTKLAHLPRAGILVKRNDNKHQQVPHRLMESRQALSSSERSAFSKRREMFLNRPKDTQIKSFQICGEPGKAERDVRQSSNLPGRDHVASDCDADQNGDQAKEESAISDSLRGSVKVFSSIQDQAPNDENDKSFVDVVETFSANIDVLSAEKLGLLERIDPNRYEEQGTNVLDKGMNYKSGVEEVGGVEGSEIILDCRSESDNIALLHSILEEEEEIEEMDVDRRTDGMGTFTEPKRRAETSTKAMAMQSKLGSKAGGLINDNRRRDRQNDHITSILEQSEKPGSDVVENGVEFEGGGVKRGHDIPPTQAADKDMSEEFDAQFAAPKNVVELLYSGEQPVATIHSRELDGRSESHEKQILESNEKEQRPQERKRERNKQADVDPGMLDNPSKYADDDNNNNKDGPQPIPNDATDTGNKESEDVNERLLERNNSGDETIDGLDVVIGAVESDVANEIDIWETGSQPDENPCIQTQIEDKKVSQELNSKNFRDGAERKVRSSSVPYGASKTITEEEPNVRNHSRHRNRRERRIVGNNCPQAKETRLVVEIRVNSERTGQKENISFKEIQHDLSPHLENQAVITEQFERWRGLDTLLQRITDQHERVSNQLKKNQKTLQRQSSI